MQSSLDILKSLGVTCAAKITTADSTRNDITAGESRGCNMFIAAAHLKAEREPDSGKKQARFPPQWLICRTKHPLWRALRIAPKGKSMQRPSPLPG